MRAPRRSLRCRRHSPVVRAESRTRRAAASICVLGPKGGIGKTLTSTNLGVALADAGHSDRRRRPRPAVRRRRAGAGPAARADDLRPRDVGRLARRRQGRRLPGRAPRPALRVLLAPVRPDQAQAITVEFLQGRSTPSLRATLRLRGRRHAARLHARRSSPRSTRASPICMVGMLDALSLKNTKLGLETLELMGYAARPRPPRAQPRRLQRRHHAGRRRRRSWAARPTCSIPSDRDVVRSVNDGEPIVLASRRSEAAKAFRALAGPVSRPTARRPRAERRSRRRAAAQEVALMELHERLAAVRPESPTSPRRRLRRGQEPHPSRELIDELGPQLVRQPTSTPSVLRERVRARHPSAAGRGARPVRAPTASGWSTRSPTTRSATGRIEQLLADDTVTEIMVNGPHDIWIERRGRLYQTTVRFTDEAHLRRIINKIVGQVGRRIDESSPMVDARLPDGSRVNAIIPPLSLSGPLLTIRKFGARAARPRRHGPARDADAGGGRVRCRRCVAGRAQHPRLRRHRLRQDDAAQRAVGRDPRRRAHRHDRGRGRAAPQPAPRAAPGGAPDEHRGRGRGHDPRPRAQRPAHAARPHHRRRGPRRRGAGHAAGDEHRPRRLAVARCTRTRRATRCRASRRWS